VLCNAAGKGDICQLCFSLHAHITVPQGGAPEAEIRDSDPNQLIRCMTCRVPVHLACLGNHDIILPPAAAQSSHSAAGPGESIAALFQCPACAAGLHPNSLQCVLCDRSGSLLQKVCFGVDDKSASSGTAAWAHSLCMRWTPDLWFDYSLRDEVNISAIRDDRRRLKCSLCKKSAGSRAGDGHALALPHSCIQCQSGKCMKSFHVSCAAERGACDGGFFFCYAGFFLSHFLIIIL
jgi:hypothetical protein